MTDGLPYYTSNCCCGPCGTCGPAARCGKGGPPFSLQAHVVMQQCQENNILLVKEMPIYYHLIH